MSIINVAFKKTIIYYDGPQVFLAEDKEGKLYVCLWEIREEGCKWKERIICFYFVNNEINGINVDIIDADSLIDIGFIGMCDKAEEYFVGDIIDSSDSFDLKKIEKKNIAKEWLFSE